MWTSIIESVVSKNRAKSKKVGGLGLSDEWKSIMHSLRVCADSGLCADCGQEPKWACDWDLMRKAADLIERMAKELGLE